MQSLVLDTSNQYLVVAYYQDGQCIEGYEAHGKQRQSENAIPQIEAILQKHQAELLKMDEIIVTQGPGSYTGVRVGLTIAKVVKVAHPEVQVKMISSLQAYAGKEGKKVAVIDARSKKVFACAYQDGVALDKEQMVDLDDFENYMKKYPDFEVVGEAELVGYEAKEINLYKNMWALSTMIEPTKDVHQILPTYIKDVEAKQIWQPSDH